MSRGLSGVLLSKFNEDHIVSLLLVKLEFQSGTQYYSTGATSVLFEGNTYTGVGDFGHIEPVEEDKGIKMKGIRISLQGVDTTVIDLALNEAVQGRPAVVYLCVYDYDTASIVEGFELFSGYMDTVQMSRGEKGTLSLTVESIMTQFDLPNVRRFTSEDHKERYPTDKFFDVMSQSNEARIIWGANEASNYPIGSTGGRFGDFVP